MRRPPRGGGFPAEPRHPACREDGLGKEQDLPHHPPRCRRHRRPGRRCRGPLSPHLLGVHASPSGGTEGGKRNPPRPEDHPIRLVLRLSFLGVHNPLRRLRGPRCGDLHPLSASEEKRAPFRPREMRAATSFPMIGSRKLRLPTKYFEDHRGKNFSLKRRTPWKLYIFSPT